MFLQSNKLVILYLCYFLRSNLSGVFWSKMKGKLCKVFHKICMVRYQRGTVNFTFSSILDDLHSVHLPGLFCIVIFWTPNFLFLIFVIFFCERRTLTSNHPTCKVNWDNVLGQGEQTTSSSWKRHWNAVTEAVMD